MPAGDELVCGLDIGTSYFKLGLFDRAGRLRGLGRVAVPSKQPRPGWCELEVADFWQAVSAALAEACRGAGAQPGDIRAVSYSSQANTFTLLDRAGEPMTPLVVWSDLRAQDDLADDDPVCQLWRRENFLPTTGVGVGGAEFCLHKLRWFQRHQPAVWGYAAAVQTISDHFVSTLTGQRVGDEGTASLLGLWDLQNGRYWDQALAAAGLEEDQLAVLLPPGETAGTVAHAGADLLGLRAGTVVAAGSLDHHAAAVGAGVGQLADFSESTGTVMACLRYSDEYRPLDGCVMGPAGGAMGWYQLAFDGNGAAALEWYQREHAAEISIPALLELAAEVPPASDGLVARPQANRFAGLEGFVNRTAAHGHGHYVRAILESTAATLTDLSGKLSPAAPPKRVLATGGGARSDLWLAIKADMLDCTMIAPDCHEPACRGAAMFAAVAAGWFTDIGEAAAQWVSADRTIAGDTRRHEVYRNWLEACRTQA